MSNQTCHKPTLSHSSPSSFSGSHSLSPWIPKASARATKISPQSLREQAFQIHATRQAKNIMKASQVLGVEATTILHESNSINPTLKPGTQGRTKKAKPHCPASHPSFVKGFSHVTEGPLCICAGPHFSTFSGQGPKATAEVGPNDHRAIKASQRMKKRRVSSDTEHASEAIELQKVSKNEYVRSQKSDNPEQDTAEIVCQQLIDALGKDYCGLRDEDMAGESEGEPFVENEELWMCQVMRDGELDTRSESAKLEGMLMGHQCESEAAITEIAGKMDDRQSDCSWLNLKS
ncbi:uncharacterized protein KY384_008210 [Bacidia gigantensis]|uniref:uncharacterized protein n=1 Tax=Bacidia gigantensis TaxID=2732470 RepID=UPI001D05970B|nr:uncharacterized protein KY384_008210 [Bacidia gigantensis]KAG8526781.1 hypothetical protein KY384_008210 [Bacidia gigantensis]